MGAHQLRGKQQCGAALDVLAVVGVDAVRGPHSLGALHDPQVDAAAAACAGLDLQGGEALVERVQEPVDGQGLVVDGGRPLASRGGVGDLVARGQQGGVVVPLEVGDVQALHEGGDGVEQVLPGPGGAQVQDPLVTVLRGPAGAVGQDPLRVGAGQLGVDIDHLRLEPQAELHAQGVDVLHERLQTVRPGLGGDLPVAQSGGVVAPGAEPAVVQDIALDAGLGRSVGQGLELVQVVVEVDGLPGVEQYRAGVLGMGGQRAQPGVAAVGQGVESLAPGEDGPRRGVGLAGGQRDLSGQEQLPGPQELAPRGRVHRQVADVAGPGDMSCVDAPAAPAEAGGAGGQPGDGVVPGAPLPGLAQAGAGGEGSVYEPALLDVVPGGVEQFVGAVGYGQHRGQLADDEVGSLLAAGLGAVVSDPGAHAHQPAGLQAQLGSQGELVGGVGSAGADHAGGTGRSVLGALLVGEGGGVGREGRAVGT